MTGVDVLASIIVATRDRAELLEGCLKSIGADRSSVPRELIVVDNGSSDHTCDLVRTFAEEAVGISVRLLIEPRAGHSFARNAGVAVARGRLLLFTDDDVLVENGWADALAGALDDERVGAVGGRILPSWPYPPPTWMNGDHSVLVTLRDFGPGKFDFQLPDVPLGANMAIRAEVLRGLREPFDTSLGHRPGVHGGSEESLLLERIADGFRLVYEPSAVVIHRIQPQRIDWDWMRAAFFQVGVTIARKEELQGVPQLSLPRLLVRSVRTYRGAVATRKANEARGARSASDALEEFRAYLWAGKHVGALLCNVPLVVDRLAKRARQPTTAAPLSKARRRGPTRAQSACIHVVSTYPQLKDGIARYADQYTDSLRDRGENVRRVGLPGSAADTAVNPTGWLRPLNLLRAARRGHALVLMWHPEFFLRGRAASRAATYAALGLVARRRRTTVVVHEPDLVSRVGGSALHGLVRALEERARRWWWDAPATLVFHSRRERDDFARAHPRLRTGDRLRIVPHEQSFRPYAKATRSEARRALGLHDHPLFLCAGFLGRHKGFDRAVRAFSTLPSGSARLHVLGSLLYGTPDEREYADELHELVEQVTGATMDERFVDDEELDLWIQAADAVLVPYRSAASSGVVARARLLGTKVVARAVGGVPEQLGPDDRLVETDDELALTLAELAATEARAAG